VARPSARIIAMECARALDDNIAENVLVMDVRGLTPVTDFIVIATASSPPHVKALAGAVEERLEKAGTRPHHVEGDQDSPWVLVDCVDVIIHVFRDSARRYYDLERLWADAKIVGWKAPKKPKKGR
jgi:ribosome-associated protein